MELTYKWKIAEIGLQNEGGNAGAVVRVLWEKYGEDGEGNTGMFAGATPFSSTNTDNFTPASELTESQVIEWVKAKVTDEYEEHVNEQILKDLKENISPIEMQEELPWAAGGD
jgi:hypothetical protein